MIPPILGAFVDVLGPIGYARGFFVYVVLGAAAIVLAISFIRAERAPLAEARPGDRSVPNRVRPHEAH